MTPITDKPLFDTAHMLNSLAMGPTFLRELLSEIPEQLYKQQRKAGKWTIHEHAIHLTMVDDIMIPRLVAFRKESNPKIVPYNPSKEESAGSLLDMDLSKRLDSFDESRTRLIEAFAALEPGDYNKRAEHPEYTEYTPKIMLRHLMMHDHLHCYRIEELWLTRDEALN